MMNTMRVTTYFVDQFGTLIGPQSSVSFPSQWNSTLEFQAFKLFKAMAARIVGSDTRTEIIKNGVRISETEAVGGLKQIQEIVLELPSGSAGGSVEEAVLPNPNPLCSLRDGLGVDPQLASELGRFSNNYL